MQNTFEKIILLKLELGTWLASFENKQHVPNNINVDLPQKCKLVSFPCLMKSNVSSNLHKLFQYYFLNSKKLVKVYFIKMNLPF